MRNTVQLIAYADRLGGDFASLRGLVDDDFAGAFGGIHVLPFFIPYDGADAGFDPDDHTAVDPRLGTWDDVARLGADYDLVVDVIVNHISSRSRQFLDFQRTAEASPWSDMFLTFSSVFPEGATESDLTSIYRPRPGLPLTVMDIAGERRLIWTTFTAAQVDLDQRSPRTAAYLESIVDRLGQCRTQLIRMDAAGYAVKTPGTSSFMTPATHRFIADFRQLAAQRGISTLVEVHSHPADQIAIARTVDYVYDFALPGLVLHAFYTGDHAPLAHWLSISPRNAVTVLDTHDGIGIIDVGPQTTAPYRPGLLNAAQIDALVESIHSATGDTSRQATGAAASNLDLYQVNTTYFDAMRRDERAYLAARALQFFAPGTPQVYYVGALAGTNAMDLLAHTGVGRDINRRYYSVDDVHKEVERPVVSALLNLARFRNRSSAFDGDLAIQLGDDGQQLSLCWVNGSTSARLVTSLHTGEATLSWAGPEGSGSTNALLVDPPILERLGQSHRREYEEETTDNDGREDEEA